MAKKKGYYYNSSAYEEAIRTLRTNIQFSDVDKKIKKILITSSVPNEGKTTVSVNLAKSFAKNNFKVLLIDSDLRNPSVNKELKIENNVGLTNVLLRKKDLSAAIMKGYDEENLDVLLSGPIPPNPSEILSSYAMKNTIKELEEKYDYIIIDTPPTGIITDTAILSTISDGVILVVRSNYTKKEQVESAIESIDKVGGKFIGVVMTFAKKENSNYGDYY
ncbi:MAG: CpsD/CapB family tyrosine-protein kinase [Peptoniphilaceae bacterium]|nr:CpsD/CapB family tyrosine-protein kinase [Peptoniphilaceae bacterium]MDY6018308.1 CpsD/CapB family tyrosine-protein kinase [Anaerococcus sp.]